MFVSLQINQESEKLAAQADAKIGHGAGEQRPQCKTLHFWHYAD